MLKSQILRGCIAMLLAFVYSTSLCAHGLLWRFLGDTLIGVGQDHDRIQVDSRQGPFSAVQLRVNGDAIFCQRLVVNFGNGSFEELLIGDRISSEFINLKGSASTIKSVELWYFREPWQHVPHVSLYGTR